MLFELWCWRRLLRVSWTARRSNQSILKEISPEYSLEGLMLKLKLQYFGHLMQRADSFEKTLMLGKIEGGRRRGQQWIRWLDGITNSIEMFWVDSGSWCCAGRPGVLQFIGLQRAGHNWVTELNWTDVPFMSTSWRFFIINGCWILSKTFSTSIEIIGCFFLLQFVNMLYHTGWFAEIEKSSYP